MDREVYLMWLSLACTPGSTTFAKLLESFDDPKDIYDASEGDIQRSVGSRSSDYLRLTDKDLEKAKSVYEFCKRRGVGILSYFDEEFPESLRDIPTPPVLLYYRGILPKFNEVKPVRIAVVGTRHISDYGRTNAFKVAFDLACSGAIIVSGMATGIDGIAHAATLAAGMPTIAFLGSGIDVCYPKQHLKLAREIVKSGCIFTEYPPGSAPDKHNFPIRNRLISGLCSSVVVVEGSERSGALHTARHAKAQGRVVYAIPGNVNDINSQATNLLIQNGAKLCARADDVVRDYMYNGSLNPFNMKLKLPVNIMQTLTQYSVVAVAPSDDIFKPARSKKKEKNSCESEKGAEVAAPISEESQQEPVNFDARTLKLYKKIPSEGDCAIEELVDDDYNLREIMRLLLKLEMGRFIVMLPGERVKRNLK